MKTLVNRFYALDQEGRVVPVDLRIDLCTATHSLARGDEVDVRWLTGSVRGWEEGKW